MKFRSSIPFLLMILLSANAHAAGGAIQRARFRPFLEDLARLFPQGKFDPKQVGERALRGGARGVTLNVQGLTRIYKELDDDFEDIGDAVKAFATVAKDLEDDIGELDKWTKIQQAAGGRASRAEQERIQSNIDNAREAYFDQLTADRWVRPNGKKTVVQKTQEQFERFNWPSDREDREFVLGEINKQVKKVRDTKYDMRVLQKGKGLHELRRELRWILIEVQAVAGLVAPEDRTECPIAPFAGDAVKQQVVQLDPLAARFLQFPAPSRDVEPCLVTRCLLHGVLFLQTKLGTLKDQAERILGSSDSDLVPQQLLAQALQTQDLMIKSNVLQLLHDQIKACK